MGSTAKICKNRFAWNTLNGWLCWRSSDNKPGEKEGNDDFWDTTQIPLLQEDIVGVVATLLDSLNIRILFVRVCKLWYKSGMDVVVGTIGFSCCYHFFGKLELSTFGCFL